MKTKDPNSKLDYDFDWTKRLGAGETITSATVTVTVGIGLTVSDTTVVGSRVVYWVAGGTIGQPYTVTCHVVTNQGREDDRSERFTIRDR